jgi:hypothetical protein
MIENAAPTSADETIPLEKLLEKLAEQAEILQQALIERKPENIMVALAEQEKLMHILQTRQDRPAVDDPASDDTERRQAVGTLAVRARGLQRTNRRLAAAFLEAIDRTMAFVQKTVAPHAGAYNASGAVYASTAPILVQQQG